MIIYQARNVLKHLIGRKFCKVFLPNYAIFMITRRCNMKCLMCGVDKENGQNDLPPSGYQRLFNTGLKKLDVVKITGGEPFIREDAPEIMNLILEWAKPEVFHITTNGYFTDRIKRFLTQIGNRKISVSISLDGGESTHNRIRGLPDAFQRATETLKMINKDHRNVKAIVNCTISSYNYKEFHGLKESLPDIGINRIVYFIADPNEYYTDPLDLKKTELKEDEQAEKLSDENKERIYSAVDMNNRNQGFVYRLLNSYYLTGLGVRMGKGHNKFRHDCMSLWSYFRMEPNGDIRMCYIKSHVAGNIMKQGFNEIWFGRRCQELRMSVRACTDCWKECEVIPSCVYSGNLFRFILKKGLYNVKQVFVSPKVN